MVQKKARSSLQTFLKREVKKSKSKIKPPGPDKRPLSPDHVDRYENHFAFDPTQQCSPSNVDHDRNVNECEGSDLDNLFDESDIDSLFGDPINTPTIKEQEAAAKLKQLLSTGTPSLPIPKFTESAFIQNLREDLTAIILLESDGKMGIRERRLLERQKGPLIEEISYHVEKEKSVFEGPFTAPMFQEI